MSPELQQAAVCRSPRDHSRARGPRIDAAHLRHFLPRRLVRAERDGAWTCQRCLDGLREGPELDRVYAFDRGQPNQALSSDACIHEGMCCIPCSTRQTSM